MVEIVAYFVEVIAANNQEGPEGVKWELGLASFTQGKWDWYLVTGNGNEMSKMGMG